MTLILESNQQNITCSWTKIMNGSTLIAVFLLFWKLSLIACFVVGCCITKFLNSCVVGLSTGVVTTLSQYSHCQSNLQSHNRGRYLFMNKICIGLSSFSAFYAHLEKIKNVNFFSHVCQFHIFLVQSCIIYFIWKWTRTIIWCRYAAWIASSR